MASWDRKFTGGSYTGSWNARLDYWEDGWDANANTTLVRLRMYVWANTGSQTGLFVPRVRSSAFGGEAGGNWSGTIGTGMQHLVSWDGWVGHDANGERYITIGDYCNAPVNDMSWADIGWTLTKLYRAPGIAGITADTIKPTSVRLGGEITDLGLGTSVAMRMYYRIQGEAGWAQTADQGDASGYNYWTVTGLKPGKTYEYKMLVWNNNGSERESAIQTFKTKSVPGMVPALMGIIG